jgi:hypothetical protein
MGYGIAAGTAEKRQHKRQKELNNPQQKVHIT